VSFTLHSCRSYKSVSWLSVYRLIILWHFAVCVSWMSNAVWNIAYIIGFSYPSDYEIHFQLSNLYCRLDGLILGGDMTLVSTCTLSAVIIFFKLVHVCTVVTIVGGAVKVAHIIHLLLWQCCVQALPALKYDNTVNRLCG